MYAGFNSYVMSMTNCNESLVEEGNMVSGTVCPISNLKDSIDILTAMRGIAVSIGSRGCCILLPRASIETAMLRILEAVHISFIYRIHTKKIYKEFLPVSFS